MEVFMSLIFVFFAMLFCHIIDDFVLQGKLAELKQKEWWEEHYPNDKYKFDYITCLIAHAVEWTFMITLPLAIHAGFNATPLYILGFIVNVIIHAVTDDLKCNKKLICLEADQIIHLAQIIFTFFIYALVKKFGIM